FRQNMTAVSEAGEDDVAAGRGHHDIEEQIRAGGREHLLEIRAGRGAPEVEFLLDTRGRCEVEIDKPDYCNAPGQLGSFVKRAQPALRHAAAACENGFEYHPAFPCAARVSPASILSPRSRKRFRPEGRPETFPSQCVLSERMRG